VRASDQVAEVRLYTIDCGRMDFKDMGALFSDTGDYAGQAGTGGYISWPRRD